MLLCHVKTDCMCFIVALLGDFSFNRHWTGISMHFLSLPCRVMGFERSRDFIDTERHESIWRNWISQGHNLHKLRGSQPQDLAAASRYKEGENIEKYRKMLTFQCCKGVEDDSRISGCQSATYKQFSQL